MEKEKLAIEGGPKAKTTETKYIPKYGIEELVELIKLWGLKPESEEKVRSVH